MNAIPNSPKSGKPNHEVQPQIPGIHTADPITAAAAEIPNAIVGRLMFKRV
jgi:hypothetical protein